MISPAQRHYQRVMAGKVSAQTDDVPRAACTAYELMLAKLHTDRARLSDVQSVERKIAVKRELLPEYEAWVTGALETGNGAQDAVLMTVLVWYIDVGDYARALDVADYALRHNLALPDQYDRTLATVLADEIGDAALTALRDKADFPLDVLRRTMLLTNDQDMPDQARAKLYKAAGGAIRSENPAQALDLLRRALELHAGSGVKRDIAALETELKQAGTPAT